MELHRRHRGDLLAVATLLLTALVIGLPILSGGFLTYLDNPVHLTEVWSLARGGGWSSLAFCGFPLGELHSPLWYGLLSIWSREGFPLEPLYALLLLISFAAPAVALYHVARRFLPPLFAAFPAYLLLVQHPSIVGLESAWGGMWTWYLAIAGLLLLMDRLTREGCSPGRTAWIAALFAIIGLTHLYALFAATVVSVIHLLFLLLSRPRPLRKVATDLGGIVLGGIASAAYWAPVWLSRQSLVLEQMSLPFGKLLLRLLLPTDMILLYLGVHPVRSELIYTDAIPMIILVGAGLSRIAFSRASRATRPSAYGFCLAIAFLLLLAILPKSGSGIAALLNWRHLYTVRVGFCLAALPLLLWLAESVKSSGRRLSRWIPLLVAVAAIGTGFWWGRPLRLAVPDPQGEEVQQVRSLWRWLQENGSARWGRVYVQDTYMCPPLSALTHSHILARTSEKTGLPQLGSWYGVVPYGTGRWTRGEFGAFFDFSEQVVTSPEAYQELLHRLLLSNTGLVVISDPSLAARLEGREPFDLRGRIGRFALFEVRGALSRWVEPIGRDLHVDVVSYRPGSILFEVRASIAQASMGIRESWHPFWRIKDQPQVRMSQNPYGLISLENIPPGQHVLDLEWRPPRSPLFLSLLGWTVILVIGVFAVREQLRLRSRSLGLQNSSAPSAEPTPSPPRPDSRSGSAPGAAG